MAFRTHRGHFKFLVMSFGLTNALMMFQALMNDILKPHIRHFVLVFFTISSSLAPPGTVLQQMRDHHLFAKCFFGEPLMPYLGHVNSPNGVAMNSDKVAAVEA